MSIEIREMPPGEGMGDFLGVVDYIYRDDASFVRPLDFDMKDRLSKRKNPFFDHGEARVFTAHRNGKCVGRATASIDQLHLTKFRDDTGFFGFLDTVDDQAVASALLDRAGAWLKERGMKRALGPFSLCINEEIGCLVEGFDTPPMLYMPHHRPYQGQLIEGAGYTKAKDVYAWRYEVGDLPERVKRARTDVLALPGVRIRQVDLKNLERDIRLVMAIHEDAWNDNWGAVPFTERELKKMAADFRLILTPELTSIVEIDGEPAAFAVAIPNLNEMIGDLGGKLFPTGALKLIYRLKLKGATSARLAMLGVRKKYRSQKKYAGLSAFLYGELSTRGKALGIRWGELSWTLEDNSAVNAGIRMMGAKIYKRYRVYERALA